MNILLIAPYFGGSHKAWAAGYARQSGHDVRLLTLPARFWKWRMQGGAATLAAKFRQLAFIPDLLLVTDMLNLPAFLGLTRAQLHDVPTVLYCHENQLTYPVQAGEKRDLTYAMINWLSMLAADHLFFNSSWHRKNWFAELPRLLKHFPDCTHLPLIPAVKAKSTVLPVGCDLARLDPVPTDLQRASVPLILWNQRWEYDKAPQTFFRALNELLAEGVEFRVALAGSNVRQSPEEFESARERWGERVVHYGHADVLRYQELLWQADLVVSTAIHEFFGISIVEALYCGCFPILPKQLSYPELLPRKQHEASLYEDFEGLKTRLRWALLHPEQAREQGALLRPAVAQFDWGVLAPRYDQLLGELAAK